MLEEFRRDVNSFQTTWFMWDYSPLNITAKWAPNWWFTSPNCIPLDPVMRLISQSCILGPRVHVGQLHTAASPNDDLLVRHSRKPLPTNLTPPGHSQEILAGIKSLFTGNFDPFTLSLAGQRDFMAKNNPVNLEGFRGQVEVGSQRVYAAYDNPNSWDGSVSGVDKLLFLPPDGSADYTHAVPYGTYPDTLYNSNTRGIIVALQNFRDQLDPDSPSYSDAVTGVDHFVNDVNWGFTYDGLLDFISYSGRVTVNFWFDGEYYYGWDYSAMVQLRMDQPVRTNYSYGTPFRLNDLLSARFVHTFSLTEIALTKKPDDHGPYTWSPFPFASTSGSYEILHEPLLLWGSYPGGSLVNFSDVRATDWVTGVKSIFSPDFALDTMSIRNPYRYRDFATMAAMASKEATEQALLQVDSNFLETLGEGLDGIKSLFSPLWVAWTLYRKIRSGDIWGSGIHFVHLLASSKLCLDFGLAPNYDSAVDLATKAKPILNQLRNFKFPVVTGHGKTVLQVPYDYFGIPAYVTSRTTVRLSYDPDLAFLAYLLPVKAFGLLPTISNFWDTRPWSFFVDWFANVGGKSDAVDQQLIAMLLSVAGSCSSTTITLSLTDEYLSDFGINRIGPTQPSFTLYDRFVEPFIPSYRPTTVDLAPAGGVPDLGLGAALLWTTVAK